MKISIGKAAEVLGVSRHTLRRWESAGKIMCERTATGHRRYDVSGLLYQKKHLIHVLKRRSLMRGYQAMTKKKI